MQCYSIIYIFIYILLIVINHLLYIKQLNLKVMTNYVLVDDMDNTIQLDSVYSDSLGNANDYFFNDQNWVIGEVITLEQYLMLLQVEECEMEM